MADADKKKTMDVSRPGKSAATPTTRPLISGHKVDATDPMVTAETDTEEQETIAVATEATKPTEDGLIRTAQGSRRRIEPIGKHDEDVSKEPEADAAKPETSEGKVESSESAEIDALADETAKKNVKKTDEEAERAELVKKLVADKKYFLPIKESQQSRHNNGVVIGLLIIVGLIGMYTAIDAGALDIGITLPFDLIKN